MLQAATGLLTLLDVNTQNPKVFWRGKPFAVRAIVVAGNACNFQVTRGLHSAELLADLISNNIKLKEVAA